MPRFKISNSYKHNVRWVRSKRVLAKADQLPVFCCEDPGSLPWHFFQNLWRKSGIGTSFSPSTLSLSVSFHQCHPFLSLSASFISILVVAIFPKLFGIAVCVLNLYVPSILISPVVSLTFKLSSFHPSFLPFFPLFFFLSFC
jgi:hypothetical protein